MGWMKVAVVSLAVVGVLGACSGDDSSANVTTAPAPSTTAARPRWRSSSTGSVTLPPRSARRSATGPRGARAPRTSRARGRSSCGSRVAPRRDRAAGADFPSCSSGRARWDPDSRGALSRESRLLGVGRRVVSVDQRGTVCRNPASIAMRLPRFLTALARVDRPRPWAATLPGRRRAAMRSLPQASISTDTTPQRTRRTSWRCARRLGSTSGSLWHRLRRAAGATGARGRRVRHRWRHPRQLDHVRATRTSLTVERAKDAVVRRPRRAPRSPPAAVNTPNLDANARRRKSRKLDAAPYTTTVKEADGRGDRRFGAERCSQAPSTRSTTRR